MRWWSISMYSAGGSIITTSWLGSLDDVVSLVRQLQASYPDRRFTCHEPLGQLGVSVST